jgi:hypothetical protein
MNTDRTDTENLIESTLTEAVGAFRPPAGLKQAVGERIQAEQRQTKPVSRKPVLKRWIGRALATAAAAALLIAATLIFTPRNGSSSSAYAELIQAIKNSQKTKWKWVHVETSLDKKGMRGKWEVWFSVNPERMFNKLPNGMAQWSDGEYHQIYDPSKKTITITRKPWSQEVRNAWKKGDMLSRAIAMAQKEGAKIAKSRQDGLIVYTITYKQRIREKYYVDPKTRRILQLDEHVKWGNKGELCVLTRKFDYPKTGPKDIYDLGVPRDAKVVDLTNSTSPAIWKSPAPAPRLFKELMQVFKNSRTAEWVHCVTFDGQEGWFSLKPYRSIQKSAQGGVIFDDGNSYKSLRYDPKQKTIWVQDSMLDSDAKAFASMLDYAMSMINKDRDRGAVFKKSESKVNGKNCTVYYVVNRVDKKRWKKLAVAIDTRQLVRFEMLQQGQKVAMDFDYPKSGPKDIYALGVPRDAKIVDVRTRDEHSNRMLANANRAKRQFDNCFKAIVAHGRFDRKTGKMAVDSISVYYQTRYKRRIDRWTVSNPKEQVDPNSAKDLEKYVRAHKPSGVDMTAPGGGGIYYNLTSPRRILKSVDSVGEPARFQNILWKAYHWQYGRAIPNLKGPNGLLQGTQRIEPATAPDGVIHRLPTRWTIYLNPQRDYIAEKYEEWVGSLKESWVPRDGLDEKAVVAKHVGKPRKTTTTVLKYAKTPAGHWYARRQLIEGYFQGRSGTFMRVIHVDTTYKFPDGLFSPEQFEAQLKRPVKNK